MKVYRSTAIASFLAALVAAIVSKHFLSSASLQIAKGVAAGIHVYPDRAMLLGLYFCLAHFALLFLGLLFGLFSAKHKEHGSRGTFVVLIVANLLFWMIWA